MQKTFFYSLLTLTALLLFVQSPSAEAREHSRRGSSTNVHVGVGTAAPCRNNYTVQRHVRPAPTYYYAPVYAAPVYAAPVYGAPVYAEPVYVEEVYVAPAPRPFSFAGLSFSWSFFR